MYQKNAQNSGRIIHLLPILLALCLSIPSHALAEKRESVLIKESTANINIQKFLIENNINSLRDYVAWLSNHVKYKADAGDDVWASPEETLQNKSGDCEDIAFLNAEVLKALGYKPKVLAFNKQDGDHVICIFKKDGFYQVFDNNRYYAPKAPSMKHIFFYLKKNHGTKYLAEIELDPKNIKLIYVNRNPSGYYYFGRNNI